MVVEREYLTKYYERKIEDLRAKIEDSLGQGGGGVSDSFFFGNNSYIKEPSEPPGNPPWLVGGILK